MGRLRRPFGNLSVIILKKKMELRSILILQGFKQKMIILFNAWWFNDARFRGESKRYPQ